MSDNPFDVFAADLKAAVPVTQNEATASPTGPINIMAAPAAAPVPVMNQPIMKAPTPAPAPNSMNMNNGGMGMGMCMGMGMGMGMPPAAPMAMNGGYGQQQQQQPMGMAMAPPPNQMGMGYGAPMGGMSMGAPMAPAPAPMGQQMPMGMGGNANAMVPAANPANPYAAYGQPAPGPAAPAPAPWGMPPAPAAPAPAPAPVYDQAPASGSPFGESAPAPAPVAEYADPFGAPAPMGGMPPAPPVPPPAYDDSDPWAQPAAPAPGGGGGGYDAIVPVQNNMPGDDPFGVFNAPAPTAFPPAPASYPADTPSVATSVNDNQLSQGQILAAADGGDPWADMGFGNAAPPGGPSVGGGSLLGDDAHALVVSNNAANHKEGELPPGGEWYDARIFTPTLGVMFFKPQELTDSLFLQTDRSLVESLDDRPVVAFIVEGSSARAAGVELGHVLLKVNGIDVKNPKEASRLIKEGPRPLPLLFYVPDTTVVVAEGEHMVKYDTRETGAPNSAKDWKPKYCVIGGIIAQPWMMNMYRSKSEYDIAVIETQARRPVSVKVKQFSLQGARIQNDWQGPQMVKYKNKLHPWKYVVVLPVSRNPIKISSPNLAQLKPVHEGIRRVLMAQQRHNPNPPPRQAQPVQSDPYARQQQQQGGYGGPPPSPQQQYSGPPPPQQQQYAPEQQQQYAGPPSPPQQQQQQQQSQYAQPSQQAYGAPPPQQQQYAQPPQPGGGGGGYEPQQQGQPSQYNTAGGVGSARRKQAY
jgi:hypothetical protein